MIDRLLSDLAQIGDALTGAFLLPGEFLLSAFDRLAPDTVAILTRGHGALIVTFIGALLTWSVATILGLMFLRFCRNLVRQASAFVLTLWHRTRMALASLRMRIVWTIRSLLPHRKRPEENLAPTIEFDDLDMAVLHSVSAKGPGFAMSAPDLAEIFTLRPTQVQRSLDKLSRNKLLASVIGSTEGFENYRLTESGLAFIAMWQRQAARG